MHPYSFFKLPAGLLPWKNYLSITAIPQISLVPAVHLIPGCFWGGHGIQLAGVHLEACLLRWLCDPDVHRNEFSERYVTICHHMSP
jgi:hypothetical protein